MRRSPGGSIVSPIFFVLTLVLFVIIGFGLVNNYYWRNVRDEHRYRVERWKQLQQQGRTVEE
jgi:hypothetical protein